MSIALARWAAGLMLVFLLPVEASTITYSVAGPLLGNRTLPLFDPGLGTLTAATFQIHSTAAGQAFVTGQLAPGDVCLATSPVTVALNGANGNLSASLQPPVTVVLTPPGCTGVDTFSLPVNAGPTPALGALGDYVGVGTLPFSFTITGAETSNWMGTLSVSYTFNAAGEDSTVPEPSTWMMIGGALGALGWRRKAARRQGGLLGGN